MKPNHYSHFIETIISMVRHADAHKRATKNSWKAMRKLAEDHALLRDKESAARQFDMEVEQALQEAYSRLRALGISNPSQGNGMSTIRRNRAALREALRLGIDLNGTRAAIERTVKEIKEARERAPRSHADRPHRPVEPTPSAVVAANQAADSIQPLESAAADFVLAMMGRGFDGDSIVAAIVGAVSTLEAAPQKKAA